MSELQSETTDSKQVSISQLGKVPRVSNPFSDHFSTQSEDYARYRPTYPSELYKLLFQECREHHLAWDCGAGNGQVACCLAEGFEQVYATEPSAEQLRHAKGHPRVRYHQTRAEDSGLPSKSVDLVAAGAAVHWFDLNLYLKEVQRVAKPGALVAFWTYSPYLAETEDPVTRWLGQLTEERLKEDWPPGMEWVLAGYKTLPFPFQELPAPAFSLELDWTSEQVMGWVSTWSAVVRKQRRLGRNLTQEFARELSEIWPSTGTTRLSVPLHLRLGRC